MGNISVIETATFSIRYFPRSEIMEQPLPKDSFWKVIGRFLFPKRKKKDRIEQERSCQDLSFFTCFIVHRTKQKICKMDGNRFEDLT